MKIGDLVYYQASGFNCTHGTGSDGLATVLSLTYAPANGKSSDTAKIFLHWKGEVWDVWRLQIGHVEEKTDECW
tara:strand:- start:822 stop:1043 length:222 start_codon:yes stop_codon:yes gene_type:complete